MGEIKILGGSGEITPKEFKDVEGKLDITLPEKLKNLTRDYDAGYPIPGDVVFLDNSTKAPDGTCVGAFLAFRSDYPYEGETMIGAYKRHEDDEFFPEDLIAFALDGGGNYFCFDYRGGRENVDPPVVFWQHEAAGRPEAITPLAPNFEAFLGMLKTEEEAEAEFQALKKKYETAEL
jgi:hypothetical protein